MDTADSYQPTAIFCEIYIKKHFHIKNAIKPNEKHGLNNKTEFMYISCRYERKHILCNMKSEAQQYNQKCFIL